MVGALDSSPAIMNAGAFVANSPTRDPQWRAMDMWPNQGRGWLFWPTSCLSPPFALPALKLCHWLAISCAPFCRPFLPRVQERAARTPLVTSARPACVADLATSCARSAATHHRYAPAAPLFQADLLRFRAASLAMQIIGGVLPALLKAHEQLVLKSRILAAASKCRAGNSHTVQECNNPEGSPSYSTA
jgi:hypothetical protein